MGRIHNEQYVSPEAAAKFLLDLVNDPRGPRDLIVNASVRREVYLALKAVTDKRNQISVDDAKVLVMAAAKQARKKSPAQVSINEARKLTAAYKAHNLAHKAFREQTHRTFRPGVRVHWRHGQHRPSGTVIEVTTRGDVFILTESGQRRIRLSAWRLMEGMGYLP